MMNFVRGFMLRPSGHGIADASARILPPDLQYNAPLRRASDRSAERPRRYRSVRRSSAARGRRYPRRPTRDP